MTTEADEPTFRWVLSLEPLLSFWRQQAAPRCTTLAGMFADLERRVQQTPDLQGAIPDFEALEDHQDILAPLMSVAFPASTWDTEIAGAVTPFPPRPFYGTPAFQELLADGEGGLRGAYAAPYGVTEDFRVLGAFSMILEKVYGIPQGAAKPFLRVIPDAATGLDRYYRVTPDTRFVTIASVGILPELTESAREELIDNLTDSEVLGRHIPLERFEFSGFVVIRAQEVTESEVMSALERDLIDQDTIFSGDGFLRLQRRLQTLFGRPDLIVEFAALQDDRAMVINDRRHALESNCIFQNSNHIPLADIEGSIWLEAARRGRVVRLGDLSQKADRCRAEQHLLDAGIRSMIVAPLSYQGSCIGTFQVMSPHEKDLGPMDALLVQQLCPLFAVALQRGLDELNNNVQSVIKEKCTAVHPSVEWRFRQAAVAHMERLHLDRPSEMEPIVFTDVTPLFGQADIRGSSEARNRAIQRDLHAQLSLALDVMRRAGEAKPWPLVGEYRQRIEHRLRKIADDLSSDDEISTTRFLQEEVEPAFPALQPLGPRVTRAVDAYGAALDPERGVVYRSRREFEESVALLADELSTCLDKAQAEAQEIFPHYFEKHKTDGIDYMIYAGASMREDGRFDPFHLKNLGLWQFLVACDLARRTADLQPRLKIPLDTCHLILCNKSPLSIRFRYDEKRFDVDGAYDVRHEIIKSRLDKATINGGRERLTQPGRIAVVYTHPDEQNEILKHVEYLQAQGHLLEDLERFELDDLPGVRGLKALRVGVNLDAGALGARTLAEAAGSA